MGGLVAPFRGNNTHNQGLVKGVKLCFRYPYFHFRHGESTSTASQLTSPASQKSKDLNKVSLLLQDLALHSSSYLSDITTITSIKICRELQQKLI